MITFIEYALILYAAVKVDRCFNKDMMYIWHIRVLENLIFTHIYISEIMKSCAHITSKGCQKAAYVIYGFLVTKLF